MGDYASKAVGTAGLTTGIIGTGLGLLAMHANGGGGTTIIAAEQLKRKAHVMELDPKYCDAIIARWEKLTGQTAEVVE